MDIGVIIGLAIFYSVLVFIICCHKKIKIAIKNLFSSTSSDYLLKKPFDDPLKGDLVDDELKRAAEPMLYAWHDADENKLPARMDKSFLERMQRMIHVLKKNGIRREIKPSFSCNGTGYNDRGDEIIFRKWKDGSRDWREGTIESSLLDAYTDVRSGKVIYSKFYPNVRITVLQSRHMRHEDAKKAAESKKDKFGYTKKKKPEEPAYNEIKTIVCNSCGAEVEINAQQVTCPYCGGQLISQFHDWQTEHFALEPVAEYPFIRIVIRTLLAFISSLLVLLVQNIAFGKDGITFIGLAITIVLTLSGISIYNFILKKKQEKLKKQIVRFSEQQFKICVYEELWKQYKTRDIIDFYLGNIELKKVVNSEDTTELTVEVPINLIELKGSSVSNEKNKFKGTFTRARYPERLKATGALIEEKDCPSCRSNFVPDKNGCCSYCGYSLKISNSKWKLKTT